MYLKLRAHIECVNSDELNTFLQDVADKCEKFIVYRHPKEEAEREHIHALLYETTLSEKVLREWCNRKLKLDKSNANYSVGHTYGTFQKIKISQDNYSRYVTYMSKGKYDPMYNKGFDTDFVLSCKDEWEKNDPKSKVAPRIEVVVKAKKLTQWEIGNEAEIRYLEEYGDVQGINYKKMARCVIQILQENKILAHKMTVVHIIQDIQSRLHPESFVDSLMHLINI